MKYFILILLLSVSFSGWGSVSGIAIQAEKNVQLQVFVNGKLHNKNPYHFVRIKSQPGLFHLEVRVLNPSDRRWYVIKKDVRVEKGLEFYYTVRFGPSNKPELIETRRVPVYSPYFRNPSLYNRHPTT